MNLDEVLKIGREILEKNKIDPREARLLLAFALKIRKEELFLKKECSDEQYEWYQMLLQKRIDGEPFAYLVGHKEFMKLDFKVNENVLIPREDTEILVQEVLTWARNQMKLQPKIEPQTPIGSQRQIEFQSQSKSQNQMKSQKEKIKILDLCTGSGCIAISLAKYLKEASVTGVDISEKALEVAKENAEMNCVSIQWIKSNLFEKITETYDCIVSNPPYVPTKVMEELQKEVKREPQLALDGGDSGLDFYKKISKDASKILKINGLLAFEVGFDQSKVVAQIMEEQGFREISIQKDFSGIERVVRGILKQ